MAAKSALELWQEKLARLKSARVLATDENVKMQLDYSIEECKEHIQELGGAMTTNPTPKPERETTKGPRKWSIAELTLLRGLLLDCPSFRNSQQRDVIINQLRPEISRSISRSGDANTDTINIILGVVNYEGGMNELLNAIELFDGGSLPFERLNNGINLDK